MPSHIDLSHTITDGLITYPGLPAPTIADHLGRDAAEQIYGPGLRFQIGLVTMCTNTGTYLDVPFHRFDDGHDLTGLALERVAGVPAIVLRYPNVRAIDIDPTDIADAAGHAVLIETGHSEHWNTESYFVDHPHLTQRSAELLVDARVACVGIDSLNIDSTATGERPVHTHLLGNDVPIIEHLTNLAAVPSRSAMFTAVPPKIEGCGTFTVRAFVTA